MNYLNTYEVAADLNPAAYEFSLEPMDSETVNIAVVDNRHDVRTRAMIDLAVALLSKRGYKTRRTNGGTMLRVRKG